MRTIQHHPSHTTEYNRYPEVFRRCADHFGGNPIKILSFGCSTGEEVKALRELYFPSSEIHGVDIDDEMIKKCLSLVGDKTRFSNEPDGMYDLIFCMSVLCKGCDAWDCEYFSDFNEQIVELDKHLNIGGLFVLYNSKFRLSDSTIYSCYEPLCDFKESGFVRKHDPSGNPVGVYKHVVFKKGAAC